MLNLKIGKEAQKAIILGGMCTISYLAVYIARNILGAVTPQITEKGILNTDQIGTLSSVYFVSYAIGQLINGIIGDRIKAKYMVSFGLIFSGICNFVFPFLTYSRILLYTAYGLTGFFLSMIYGPMTKVVSENTEHIYAVRCGVGYTFASFFGSPLAGIFAAVFVWQGAFTASSIALWVMGTVCLIGFTVFEKRGLVKYNQYKKSEKSGGGIKLLIKRQIIKYTFVSILTGIIRITVIFWLPTYIHEYLGFSSEKSSLVFSAATFIISFTAIITLVIYEKLGRNMNLSLQIFFITSAIMFLLVYLVKQPVLNICCIVLAIMSSNAAASILWSMYCPSLKDTGMVSSATGYLDFVNYIAAAVASTLFANAVSAIGWVNLILVWAGLMILGITLTLPYSSIKKKLKFK